MASNALGDSSYSNELIAGVGASPPQANSPHKNLLLSNSTSTAIYWDSITTSELPINGYILLMDDGLGGPYSVVYDGSLNSAQLSYTVNGLTPSLTYNFILEAVDFNKQSSQSTSAAYVSCVAPSGMN